MRGILDEDGFLLAQRGTEMKKQFCPFVPSPNNGCGDWCPLFSEPEAATVQALDRRGTTLATKIELCHGKVRYFRAFEDKRGTARLNQEG